MTLPCVVREQRADEPLPASWMNQTGVPVQPRPAGGDVGLLLADANDLPIACLRLRYRLGLDLPRYSYHLGRVVHAAAELNLFSTQPTLMLGNDHTGDSELADLACAPGLGFDAQVAALRRLIQAALQRLAPGQRVIVELAGPRDAATGQSPFWQGLGRYFYEGDPVLAQAQHGDAWRSHLAALLPRQTLYLSFLSAAAQAAVGQVGEAGLAAAQALKDCGFAFAQHVRVDDGGAVFESCVARAS